MSEFFVLLLRYLSYLEGPSKILLGAPIYLLITTATANHALKNQPLFAINKKQVFYPIVVFLYILLHTAIFSTLDITVIAILYSYLIWYFFCFGKFQRLDLFRIVRFMVLSFAIYNLANYIWYELAFSDLQTGINTTLEYFGIVAYRVNFPMASGPTTNAAQVGTTSLFVLYLIKLQKGFFQKKILQLLYLGMIYLMLVIDSRFPLAVTLLLGLISVTNFKQVFIILRRFWWVFVLIAILLIIVFYGSNLFESIKRPGEFNEDYFSRPKIWQMALEAWSHDLRLFTGYGLSNFREVAIHTELGQGFYETELNTTHNIYLMVLVDFGLIGFLALAYFIFKYGQILYFLKEERMLTLIFIAFFLFGIVEALPSFYSFTNTLQFIAVIALINKRYYDVIRQSH